MKGDKVMGKGVFINLDGTDGTGKKTQIDLLGENLKSHGYSFVKEDFPQYGQRSAAMVEAYLNGEFGPALELGPYIPSFFYASDRFAGSHRIKKNLESGLVVISNRYVTANMAHQGGKISDLREREKFFQWLFDLEFGIFRIPEPGLNIILHMPAEVAQGLVDEKGERGYTTKKRDIHEADLGHLKAAENTYLEISRKFGYPLIECYVDGKILSREEIAALIWEKVSGVIQDVPSAEAL